MVARVLRERGHERAGAHVGRANSHRRAAPDDAAAERPMRQHRVAGGPAVDSAEHFESHLTHHAAPELTQLADFRGGVLGVTDWPHLLVLGSDPENIHDEAVDVDQIERRLQRGPRHLGRPHAPAAQVLEVGHIAVERIRAGADGGHVAVGREVDVPEFGGTERDQQTVLLFRHATPRAGAGRDQRSQRSGVGGRARVAEQDDVALVPIRTPDDPGDVVHADHDLDAGRLSERPAIDAPRHVQAVPAVVLDEGGVGKAHRGERPAAQHEAVLVEEVPHEVFGRPELVGGHLILDVRPAVFDCHHAPIAAPLAGDPARVGTTELEAQKDVIHMNAPDCARVIASRREASNPTERLPPFLPQPKVRESESPVGLPVPNSQRQSTLELRSSMKRSQLQMVQTSYKRCTFKSGTKITRLC